MRGLSLRVKVFFLFAGTALVIVVPALLLIARAVERQAYRRATDDLEFAGSQLLDRWQIRAENLEDKVDAKAGDSTMIAAWEAGRLGRVERRLSSDTALEKEEVVVADTAFRTLVGSEIRREVLEGAVGGAPVVVFPDSGPPLRLAVRTVYGDSLPLGIMAIGRELTAVQMKKELGPKTPVTGLALAFGDTVLGYSFEPDTADQARDTAIQARAAAAARAAVLHQPQGGTETYAIGNQAYRARVFVLPGAGPSQVRVALFRPAVEEERIAVGIKRSLVGIGIGFVLLALVLAAVVARIVAGPTQALAEAAKRLARGDYGAPLPRDSGDEIGQLSRTFGEMRRTLAEREARLRSAQAEMIHREKLAAMGRLVAQLSHEINNPIYNIQNLLEALERRGDPGDPNREFLELAQEELARMATLTRQLLDQSRPLSDAAQPVSLNTLVHRVLTLAGPELQARGIRAETDLAADLPRVVVHPEGVQQVLANLVNNALDAMPGGGTLRLSTRADADAVEVVVEDTGTGIAEKDLPHIFEAFYTTKPGVAGIGLGLFVSEGIIRGHRGRLVVESRPGEGSRFTVRLPRETLDEAAAPGEPRPDEEAAAAAA